MKYIEIVRFEGRNRESNIRVLFGRNLPSSSIFNQTHRADSIQYYTHTQRTSTDQNMCAVCVYCICVCELAVTLSTEAHFRVFLFFFLKVQRNHLASLQTNKTKEKEEEEWNEFNTQYTQSSLIVTIDEIPAIVSMQRARFRPSVNRWIIQLRQFTSCTHIVWIFVDIAIACMSVFVGVFVGVGQNSVKGICYAVVYFCMKWLEWIATDSVWKQYVAVAQMHIDRFIYYCN